MRSLRLLAWSLRKMRLPIKFGDLVLEIGSGGNPHPASSVLAEKFLDSSHRLKAIKIDREIVLADACQLPFRDKAFDYSIAFHVLEHVPDPEAFAQEVSRVSRAGYVETPNVLYERFLPFDVHLLEVAKVDNCLIVAKKPAAKHDEMLKAACLATTPGPWKRLFESRPELFHVCYRWRDKINLRVINPLQSTDWHEFPDAGLAGAGGLPPECVDATASAPSLRQLIIAAIRQIYILLSPRKVDIESLLVCPQCRSELVKDNDKYSCTGCSSDFTAKPIPDFTQAVSYRAA